jgi:hypothetical protein
MRQTIGGVGAPTRPGGRRRVGGSAAVSRVVAIGNGSASDGRRSRSLPQKPCRWSARVSAQPTLRKNILVPVRVATCCSFLRGVRLVNGSVRAYAARLYGESCSARRDGDGGVKGRRGVVAGFRPGAGKYVVAYFRSQPCGPRIVPSLRRVAAAILPNERCQAPG